MVLSFSDRLISLSLTPCRSIHVVENGELSFFSWLTNIPLYIYHLFSIHLPMDGHLGYFHILTIVNNAAITVGVHVSFQISGFVSLGK